MSIRFRLVLSYIAMLVVPVVLTVIAAIVLLVYNLGEIGHSKLGPDFLSELPQRAVKISSEVGDVSREQPDKFLDLEYVGSLDRQLSVINAGIVIRDGMKLIYTSKNIEEDEIFEKLKSIKSRDNEHVEMLEVRDRVYAVVQYDFVFSSGSAGSVYMMTDISPIGRFTAKYFSALGLTVLIILVLTNGVITYLVSRSILKPLKLLKNGTEQIKQGNLNFQVKSSSNDEIGDVCVAFEQMRQKLKESIDTQLQYEENRKELISSISHDLKTPITAIKGYVEGILDGVADTPEKLNKYIRTISTKAQDMDQLIDDLFLFSKLDLKKLPFNFEKIEPEKFFEDCIDEMRMDLEKKGIELNFHSEPGSHVSVLADRDKLKRVAVNIISNAGKYMDKEKGRIDIILKEDQEMLVVQIRDNGQGIRAEDLPFIFERFYRADPSRNTSTGGSGLGLAIAKQIIEGHGGRIWAESEIGTGTGIYFSLKKA